MRVLEEDSSHLHTTVEKMFDEDYQQALGDMVYADTGYVYGSYDIVEKHKTDESGEYVVRCYDDQGMLDTGFIVIVKKKDILDRKFERAMKVC